MRSGLATIILGWGAVYGYAALYGFALWWRARERREYLTFGLVATALIVQCVGGVLLTDATSVAGADLAIRVKMAGAVFTLAFIHHFAIELAGLSWPRLVRAGYAFATLATVLAITGLATADTTAPEPTWGFSNAPDYLETRLTLLGGIGGSLGFVFVASTLLALVDARRQDERAGLVLWAFVANTLAVCHDAMIQSASLRSVYLSEHAALLTMWAVSLILLDRLARASEELDLRTRQLSSSVGELKHTEAELVKKEQLAAVGALSGLIAHQVETPLATIQHATSNLGRADLDAAERLELLALLDEEVERLNRLVNDLLAYARPVKRQVRPITIAEVVSECLGRSVREDDGIAVEVSLDGAPTTLYADSDLLRSALDNIVENAVQAMPGGGRIAVRASDDVLDGEPAVVLEIEDDGPGMDEETYDRSREPFFTTRSLGTGLGLAIVDRVIKMHGGELVVESALGRGTKVSIRLPLGEPTASITPSDERGRKMLGDGHAQ